MLFNPLDIIYRIPALLIAITVHEYAHGRVSQALGDPTPGRSGRLSLNPIHHLDPIGSLMILLVGFGWAKPVPVNPNYYKNPRLGMAIVGLAGPVSNFVSAIVLGRLGSFFINAPFGSMIEPFLFWLVAINVILGVFNLIPIPPLDGSKLLAYFIPERSLNAYWQFERYGILVLVAVLFFFGTAMWSVLTPVVNFILGATGLPIGL